MQRYVEVWSNTRRIATVAAPAGRLPTLQEVTQQVQQVHHAPDQGPIRFRLDGGVVPSEDAWQRRAQQQQGPVVKLTLREPELLRQVRAKDGSGKVPGERYAICGPIGDTVYDSKANFLTCVRTLVKSGLPPDYRLVFPPADEQEILGILRGEAGLEVLTAVGSMKLTKDWHRQAANVGGLAASVQCSLKLCKESLKAVGQRGQFMKGVAQGIGGLAASLILGKLVQNGLEYALPRLFQAEYAVAMRKSDGNRQEIVRVSDGVASRELLLGLEIEEMLADFEGQDTLKRQIRDFGNLMYQQSQGKPRAEQPWPNHMILKGNPGTGKTTVARMLGKILCHLGITQTDKLVEVQRADLVGEYVGHTAPKTRSVINSAKGGILFIDEAYRLTPRGTGGNDFGKEALEEIMRDMERGDPLVIFAGYQDEMEALKGANRGLERRIRHEFQMADYTPLELAKIFQRGLI
ncbi:unnamed protein product [Effrenium voratum]|nr:unnamed protein product [Effrenium voratum]